MRFEIVKEITLLFPSALAREGGVRVEPMSYPSPESSPPKGEED
jgi:hypothetical protein